MVWNVYCSRPYRVAFALAGGWLAWNVPNTALDLGLLLDIDGPIASPVSRSIAIASILDDIVALTAPGVPIAFITGRSDAFVREVVIAPLMAAGLGAALAQPGARMFTVFEKGATWATVAPDGLGPLQLDESVQVPQAMVDAVRELHGAGFTDTMFWDDTKHAMISIEARTDVAPADYHSAQLRFDEAAFARLAALGYGIRLGERESADSTGAVPYRIDPTIISTDIESVLLDKDRGAQRALEYFAESGPLPRVWRSVGDSRSDYKMADYVHSLGLEVAHVDVRPLDGIPERPYRVITEGDLVHDEAGAAFLAFWAAQLDKH